MTESEADGTESHPNLDAPSPNNENGDRRETQAEEPPALQGDMTDSRDADEASRLQALEAHVRDQGDLERDIEIQADKLLIEQANERDRKRLEKTGYEKQKTESRILKLHQRLSQPVGTAARVRIEADLKSAETQLSSLEEDLKQIQQRINDRERGGEDAAQGSGTGRLPNESRRDYLIRTGKITPFSKLGTGIPGAASSALQEALIDAEDEREAELVTARPASPMLASHRNLRRPGFEEESQDDEDFSIAHERPQKRRKVGEPRTGRTKAASPESNEEYVDSATYVASTADSSSDEFEMTLPARPKKPSEVEGVEDLKGVDDGDEKVYQSRLRSWVRRRSQARTRAMQEAGESSNGDAGQPEPAPSDEEEWFLPHPTVPDTVLDGEYKIPGDIYPYLFDYQKTGVQWLWELYQQRVGGIIGDEMGLGKTIQVIAFLAGLHYSKKLTRPAIVICPATVMKQWVNEFHRWWPPFRVSILHTSGSGMINVKSESREEDRLMSQSWDFERSRPPAKGQKAARRILNRVLEEGHVLVTTYSGLQTYASLLIPVDWGCAILDEGHKIRNPDTAITIHCKELRTPHRLILSGTPMQNNLTELWSLFDFVFPMRLGTLVNFRNQFEFPIRQGGYANASNLQVQTAARCAETLKEAISPYLLQRFKADVAADLPKKSEQVLFCKLTKIQRTTYETFLQSNDMSAVMTGKKDVLYGVDMLRKICNHPDLAEHRTLSKLPNYNYGSGSKSGKMQVVRALLEIWRDTGHKTLLFAQHRIMLDILERFVKSQPGFKYRRMDGNTPIKIRQSMVDEFNRDPDIHVFLLTTKVGGLGVNLTGADRVIIYDPDWNPSTDVQARERAWRLGQKREVTIYRLMTAGTIEEKIYHRQIFKQFLTNKILRDPKQRQTFQMSDLHDLFTLGSDGPTETSKLFKDADVTFEARSEDTKTGDGETATEQGRAPSQSEEKEKISQAQGVASLQNYQNAAESSRDGTPIGDSKSDSRLMESIFARSGVHSALEHDQIFNDRRTIKADPKIIEAEAKKVAAEAAKELLKAEEIARTVPIGTPTWTGQFGTAGKPGESIRPLGTGYGYGGSSSSSAARRAGTGPSSASILANLTNRTVGSASNSPRSGPGTPRGGTPGGGSTPRGKDFMVLIRDYIIAQGGAVYTQMLVDHFNRFCDSPRASAEFKEMLRTIAVLEKSGSRARGKWVLKPEYAKRS